MLSVVGGLCWNGVLRILRFVDVGKQMRCRADQSERHFVKFRKCF
jgi:hypothetical protein